MPKLSLRHLQIVPSVKVAGAPSASHVVITLTVVTIKIAVTGVEIDVMIAAMTASLAKDVEADVLPLEGAVVVGAEGAAPPHGST
jgi:hypothetical protein